MRKWQGLDKERILMEADLAAANAVSAWVSMTEAEYVEREAAHAQALKDVGINVDEVKPDEKNEEQKSDKN